MPLRELGRMINNPLAKINQQYVILDTCIIQHFGETELAECILKDLRDTASAGYGLAISDFTYFELLDGASIEKEQQRIEALAGLSRYFVKKETLITAAHLGCLYQQDSASADIGDKIIAATSLLSNSIIYTTNGRDFPRPFYDEVSKRYLKYHKNGAEIVLPSYFFKPDINYIIVKYKERTKPLERIISVLPTPSPPQLESNKSVLSPNNN